MDKLNVQERLKDFISSQNLSIREFERVNGFPNGTINAISDNITSKRTNVIVENFPTLNIIWLLTGEGEMLKEIGGINIGGDNNGVANTGKIAGDVIYNETATEDINTLYNSYNDNKVVEIDRLQALYTTMLENKDNIIAEKNAMIEELKGVISDLREDKKKLTDLLGK